MGEFTAQEIENVANSVHDYVKSQKVKAQEYQDRPFYAKMRAKKKTFAGGKDEIKINVKGAPSTTIQGFSGDDEVSYSNPANTKRATYPWKLIHSGIKMTMHELLQGGISITDSTTGEGVRRHSDEDLHILADLLEEKLEDMMEGTERGMNLMLWRDGTQDSNLVPGVRSFILDDPTSATVVAGIDQSANSWWRNRANVSINAATASNQNLVTTLQGEFRQLRRYGGRPDCAFAGSDFIEAFENELRALGNYTLTGWADKGSIDASIADIQFKKVGIMYDPTLDDEGLAKYCYVMDSRTIYPMYIKGEDGKKHRPARPENKYVFYQAETSALGLVCNHRNANGVYAIQ